MSKFWLWFICPRCKGRWFSNVQWQVSPCVYCKVTEPEPVDKSDLRRVNRVAEYQSSKGNDGIVRDYNAVNPPNLGRPGLLPQSRPLAIPPIVKATGIFLSWICLALVIFYLVTGGH